MSTQPATPDDHPSWPRTALRLLLLAVACAALQAWQPAYTLGVAPLVPLGLVLGLLVAGVLTRGASALLGGLAGVAIGQVLTGSPPESWVSHCALLALQCGLALALAKVPSDAASLQLDTWARLKRLVLVAAPAAALLGAVGSLAVAAAGTGSLGPVLSRAGLAHATGRLVVDWAGIVVACAVLLCWLAWPAEPWRPRRRLVAWPLLAVAVVMLPGLHQVARRDEQRLQVQFDKEAVARQRQLQQLLAEPVAAVAAARGILIAGGTALPDSLFDQLATGWTQRVPGLRALGWLEMVGDGSPGGGTASTGDSSKSNGGSGNSSAPTNAGSISPPPLALPHAFEAQPRSLALLGPRAASGQLEATAAVLQATAKALASDSPVTTHLAADARTGAGALLVLQAVPGSDNKRRRLVFGLVDLQRQLQAALPDDDDANLRVCVFDNPPAAATLGQGRAGQPGQVLDKLTPLAGSAACAQAPSAGAFRTQAGRLTITDRPLALLSIEPPSADNRLFTAVWLAGLPTVGGMAMLATLLLAVSGRIRRIEDRVAERTAALQAEVDERRQAERALATSEQRFRAMFESVNIGVTLVDRQGLIQMANPAFCSMMASPSDAVVGRPLGEFRLPDVADDDGTAHALGGLQATRQRYLSADGRVLQVAASLRQLHNSGGEWVGTVGALHDMTPVLQLREAERERDEADIANRTKSDFLARLSHELRAPLNAIVGFAQLIERTDAAAGQRATDDNPDLQHHVAQIRRAGWHLLDMVNDMLDLSRMEAGTLRLQLEPVGLVRLAEEAMAMLEPAAQQADVALKLSLSPQAEWVQADSLRLRQVLVNLLGNAVKYNRPGGWVELRTRPAGVGEIVIEVEDNGVGVAPDQIDALFKPFHRGGRAASTASAGRDGSGPDDNSPDGTGMGLVISRRLAELMDGLLEVSSRLGEGATFTLRLPRAVGMAQRVEVVAGAPLVSQVSIGTVLYIEDNAGDLARVRQAMAERPGITLLEAATGQQGLALAAGADLVLLDLDLPDLPGLQVLQRLREDTRLRSTPVIVVSAETRPERIDACFDAGAAEFLTKPLDAAQLLHLVDDQLKRL